MADADADDGDAELSRFLGEDDRKASAAGEQSDPLAG